MKKTKKIITKTETGETIRRTTYEIPEWIIDIIVEKAPSIVKVIQNLNKSTK